LFSGLTAFSSSVLGCGTVFGTARRKGRRFCCLARHQDCRSREEPLARWRLPTVAGSQLEHDNAFALVGQGAEIARRGRLSAVLGRLKSKFGVLGLEVVEPRLQARQALFEALGCSLPCSKDS
jgi:hypothetical protein